jgi:quercetin dioxygenase-like cupin family protein
MRRVPANRAAALLVGLVGCAHAPSSPGASERSLMAHGLPAVFGAHPRAELFEVTYPPGGSSHPHQHGCPVVGYVLEGSLRWQLQGGAERVFVAGTAFYEDPTDVHIVSANASRDRPVRFLAFFVCDDDRPLFMPARAP